MILAHHCRRRQGRPQGNRILRQFTDRTCRCNGQNRFNRYNLSQGLAVVFSIGASSWCRSATVAAVWLLLGSSDAGRLAAQAPQQRPAVPIVTTADDDAYWAQATTAKVADHGPQYRATTGPAAAGQMPAANGYPATPGAAAPWAGYPQTPGMNGQPSPQVPVAPQAPVGAYPPGQPSAAMWPAAAPQPGPAAQVAPVYPSEQAAYTSPY